MKHRSLLIFVCVLLTPLFSSCSKYKELTYEHVIYSDGREERVNEPSIDSSLKEGREVSILPDTWMNYYNHSRNYSDVGNYFIKNEEQTSPKEILISWSCENGYSEFEVHLSKHEGMLDSKIYSTNIKSYSFRDLFAGTTYYYQIHAKYSDKTIISRRFDFKTVDFMRTIEIGGALNARDFGNLKTVNGKYVKQGLFYRSANLDSVSKNNAEIAIERYGIKTELDLRENKLSKSPLGDNVCYINNGVGTYGSPLYNSADGGVSDEEYMPVMRDNLKTFVNPDNFPVIFHCAIGRDRTGTLAITLGLLLGVKPELLKEDYAVSFFSKSSNTGNFNNCLQNMDSLFRFYENYGGKGKGSIHNRAENYCRTIGLNDSEINAIRNNLLEEK